MLIQPHESLLLVTVSLAYILTIVRDYHVILSMVSWAYCRLGVRYIPQSNRLAIPSLALAGRHEDGPIQSD